MLKKYLAERWHVPKKVIDDLVKTGEIKSSIIRGYRNQKRTDISIEEVERFEELKRIPEDPISFQEIGLSAKNIADLKISGKIKTYAKITSRTIIYSRKEFKEIAIEELKKAEKYKRLI